MGKKTGSYDHNSGKVTCKQDGKVYDTRTVKTGTKEIESGTNGWREGKITVETSKTVLLDSETGKEIGAVDHFGNDVVIKFK